MSLTIQDIIERIETDWESLGITVYAPATEEEILDFERAIGQQLPDDFKTFYRYCDGFYSDEDMFRIVPLAEILEVRDYSGHNTYLVRKADFHFAEYMIYCDMWTLSNDDLNHNRYSIYAHGKEAVTLTESLAIFLDKFLTGGVFDGLYDWRDAMEAALENGTNSDSAESK